jgi:hypothetical protein
MTTQNLDDQPYCFEPMNKRRKSFPSEEPVKRGVRIVHGDKLLDEKLGRNDLWKAASCQSRWSARILVHSVMGAMAEDKRRTL